MTDKFYNRKRMAWQLYIFSDLSIEAISKQVKLPIEDVKKYIKEKGKDDCESIKSVAGRYSDI